MTSGHATLLTILMLTGSKDLSSLDYDPFAPCKPEVVQQIYQMLFDVHGFFSYTKISYWIDSGTLLGAVRHRGLIPWDDDLDVCIFEKDEQQFLHWSPLLRSLGYEIIRMCFGYKIYHVDGIEIENKPWRYPFCDIFIVITEDEKAFYRHRFNKANDQELNVKEILPLRTYSFGPLTVMGPRDPSSYLRNWYGEYYHKVAYKNYDHAKEMYIKEEIKLLNHDDYKPAWPSQPLIPHFKPLSIEQWPEDFLDRFPHLLEK